MDKETYDNEMDENKYKYSKQVFINITQLIVIIVLTVALIYFSMNQKIVLKSPYSTNKDEIISDGAGMVREGTQVK